ncbi:MAG: hypothetical protein ACE5IL_17975, partial [Myxococcota bacterium]
ALGRAVHPPVQLLRPAPPYYLQAAYRFRYGEPRESGFPGQLARLEPVVRWGEINGFRERNREQLALGVNYWLYPSVPLKISYEFNSGAIHDDRFIAQFAYGF